MFSKFKIFSKFSNFSKKFQFSNIKNRINNTDYLQNKGQFRTDFLEVFEDLVKFNTSNNTRLDQSSQNYLQNAVRYNIPHGKFIRGETLVNTFSITKDEKDKTELYNVFVLAWCLEWLQSCFLIADDIMDRSPMRRGRKCWYKCSDVQEKAINDSFILLSQSFDMVNHYLDGHEHKDKVISFLLEMIYKTECGQLKDLEFNVYNNEDKDVDISNYTEENYNYIVKYKTAYYTVFLPVILGLALNGIEDKTNKIQEICLRLGRFFQIQDDYLDCFGDLEKMGKVGRDIEEGKCSWLFVSALKTASEEQKEILKKNYGKDDIKKVERVKNIYLELKLPELYKKFEKEEYVILESCINKLEMKEVKFVLKDLLNTLLKRKK